MQTRARLKELLAQSELFRSAKSDVLDAAVDVAQRVTVPATRTLFIQGDRPERLFVVLEGRLRMSVVSENGAVTTLRFMEPGDVLGCAAVLRQFRYPATATALVDSVLLAWTARQFEKLMRDNVQLAINAAALVGTRANAMLQRLRALLSEPLEQRLARQLLQLQAQARSGADSQPDATIRISRQELAELADATIFSVSRIVSSWRRAGILSASRGQITIKNIG